MDTILITTTLYCKRGKVYFWEMCYDVHIYFIKLNINALLSSYKALMCHKIPFLIKTFIDRAPALSRVIKVLLNGP